MTTIGDLASIDALSGVSTDDHVPFVQLRASSIEGQAAPADALDVVLIGQLDPPAARVLALNILQAADAADSDAALCTLMLRRLGDDPTADTKVAAILTDLRAHREGASSDG